MTDLPPNAVTGGWEGPNLLTVPGSSGQNHQFSVIFKRDGNIRVARRNRDFMVWNNKEITGASATALNLPDTTGDTHRFPSIMYDSLGYLHLWANYHEAPMQYIKTTQTIFQDVNCHQAWTGALTMPSQEISNSYPLPCRLNDGSIFFLLRGGPNLTRSSRSDSFFWRLPTGSSTWSARTKIHRGINIPGAGPLKTPPGPVGSVGSDQTVDDDSNFYAYTSMPFCDKTGRLHLQWVWKQTAPGPGLGQRNNVFPSYAYSDNGGNTWKAADGTVLVLPIDPINYETPSNAKCLLYDQDNQPWTHPTTFPAGTGYTNTGYTNNGGLAVDPNGIPHLTVSANPWFHFFWVGTLGQPGGYWERDYIYNGGNGFWLNGFAMASTMNAYWRNDGLWVLGKASTPFEHYRAWRIDGQVSVALSGMLNTSPTAIPGQSDFFAGNWLPHADPEAFRRFGSIEVSHPDGDYPRIYTFGAATKRSKNQPLPLSITSISPSSGPAGGGTTVTITGTNLGGATSVKFGATVATIVSNTTTQIVVTSPAGTAGNVNITVTTPAGTSPGVTFSYTGTIPAPTSILGGATLTAYGVLRTVTVPTSIDSTGTTDVFAALQAYIQDPADGAGGSVPDGTRIKLQPGGQYRCNKAWDFIDRNYICIDMNGGAIFTDVDRPYGSDPNESVPHTQNWQDDRRRCQVRFWRGSYQKIYGGELRGSAAGRAGNGGQYIGAQEEQCGLHFWGAAHPEAFNLTIHETWGDGICCERPSAGPVVTFAHVHDCTIHATGRMGLTWLGVTDSLFERLKIYDIRRHVLDVEPISGSQIIQRNVWRNSDAGNAQLGLAACTPYLGATTIVTDNVMDGIRCDGTDATVGVVPLDIIFDWSNAYDINPARRLGKWTVTNCRSAGPKYNSPRGCALLARHVDGLIATGNKWWLSLWPTNTSTKMYGVGGGDNTGVEVHDNDFTSGEGEIDPVPNV